MKWMAGQESKQSASHNKDHSRSWDEWDLSLSQRRAESISHSPTDAILIEQAAAGSEWALELRVVQCVSHHLAPTPVIGDVVQLLPHEREKDARMEQRVARPSTPQLLLDGLDWSLEALSGLSASSFTPLVLDGT